MARTSAKTNSSVSHATRVGRIRVSQAANVEQVQRALDAIAPFSLAAEWDNVGLLAGKPEWAAGRVLLAIDLTDDVACEAIERKCGAIVAYHPPIFKGIRTITNRAESPTTMLADLLASRISIFSMHTALDAAIGGTNDVLLDAFDVVSRVPLEPAIDANAEYKLVVFVPEGEVAVLRAALAAAGAGRIGNYDECSFELRGRGSFRGDESTNPTRGRRMNLEFVEETRLEMVVPKSRVASVVRALYANHSYEEPAFDLYPVAKLPGRAGVGLGRVGTLRSPQTGTQLVVRLKKAADCAIATVVGDLGRKFATVTTAAGSFGTRSFRDRNSLYITGEMKHHDALDLTKRGICAICLGHDASERPVLPVVKRRLQAALPGIDVRISTADRSPFSRLNK